MIGLAQVEIRNGLESDVPESFGEGECPMAGCEGLLLVTRGSEILAHIGGDLSQAMLVTQGFSSGFGLAEGR